jgi:hypothetical protein
MTALAQPEEARATPQETRQVRRRIKELEKDLRRKEKALAETTAFLVLSKKTRGDLPSGRGRMISLEDRQMIARAVDEAHCAGARLEYACAEGGITVRTLQRWKRCEGLECGDLRLQAVSSVSAHALTQAEREQIQQIANESSCGRTTRPMDTLGIGNEPSRPSGPARRARMWPPLRGRSLAGT